MSTLHDACGVVGIYQKQRKQTEDILHQIQEALSALQHRGQESAGIAVYTEDGAIQSYKGMGKVHEAFPANQSTELPATFAGIGHVRYSTTGSSRIENAGPFVVTRQYPQRTLALAHNGNIVNAAALQAQLDPSVTLASTTDTEVLAWLLLDHRGQDTLLRSRIVEVLPALFGAYSLTILADGKLYALRDPWGLRPLCIGYTDDYWIIASETCALNRLHATFLRDVLPGELVTIDEGGVQSEVLAGQKRHSLCVFEHVYFADPTSQLNGQEVYATREAMGRELAREYPIDADFVVPVPDSSIPSALGYAKVAGIPYCQAILRNRYSERSFIKPQQDLRQKEVQKKFAFAASRIEGKRLIIIDDSIIRGTTLRYIIARLYELGAREVHIRISSPPVRHPCYFGIDIPETSTLISNGRTLEDVRRDIGVESIAQLSLAGLGRAVMSLQGCSDSIAEEQLHMNFCYGCMKPKGWAFPPHAPAVHDISLVSDAERSENALLCML